jgi:hypothetical protein
MPPIVAYIKTVSPAAIGTASGGDTKQTRLINDVKNGYYNLSKEDEAELTKAVESLESQVSFIRTRNALGLAVGVGSYVLALITAVIVFLVLLLEKIEKKIKTLNIQVRKLDLLIYFRLYHLLFYLK